MGILNIGLSERRCISQCEFYVFPEDIYDIQELQGYSDLVALQNYALNRLYIFSGKKINLYITAKLLTEFLCVVKAAEKLNIELVIYHHNMEDGTYYPQAVLWKHQQKESEIVTEFNMCSGRHVMPAKNDIFQTFSEKKMFEFELMEREAWKKLKAYTGKGIRIYATGMLSLLISVLNVASSLNISLVIMHYDFDTDMYFEQNMDEEI